MPIGPTCKAVLATMALTAGLGLAPALAPGGGARAGCPAGSDACPIRIRFRPGSDHVTVRGRLTRDRSRYSYAFAARAGQRLTWTFAGPTVRTVIRYPGGKSDGPGLPRVIRPYPVDAFWLRLGQSAGTQAMRAWLSFGLPLMASAALPPASPPGFDR